MNFIRSIKGVFWNKEENRLRMFWRLMVYSTFLSLVIVLFSAVFGITNVLSNTFFLSFVILLGVVVTTIMVGKGVDRRRIKDFGLIPSTIWWKEFFFGLGLGALLMGLVFIISWVTGSLAVEGYFQGSHQGAFLQEFLKAVGFYFAVGVYEEVMLRGDILVNLENRIVILSGNIYKIVS